MSNDCGCGKINSEIKHICFVSGYWPTSDEPKNTFVKQLVCAIADHGVKCSVIAPRSVTNIIVRKTKPMPRYWVDFSKAGNKIEIYQPRYLSFSKFKFFGSNITGLSQKRAVFRGYKKIENLPDVLYTHFWHSLISSELILEKQKLPVFVASGESEISVHKKYPRAIIDKLLRFVTGVICVSTKNQKESIDLNLTRLEETIILPNSIDNQLFYKDNKAKCREKLGFAPNDFIVAFVGAFTERKGVLRLSEALKKVKNVKSIFIGSGEQKPDNQGILFCGKLPHEEICGYLNAADVFVLPTLAEGCCNAIIEAMACGLPVISSALPFNDDILDDSCSIRINPHSVDEITHAVEHLLKDEKQRNALSNGALEKVKNLNIETRAAKILDFMKLKINETILIK
jgi:glycosyltransferase involved in cell wall biosynthesis